MTDLLFDLELSGDLATVTGVRRRLAALVEERCAHAVGDVSLVVSELVANAVEHAPGSIRVRATHQSGTLRIEVHDGGPGTPAIGTPSMGADGGRGLQIVDAVADRWGVDASSLGKVVWAEVTC